MTPVHIQAVLIGVGVLAVIVTLATLYMPRKARLTLYTVLVLIAGSAWAYVTINRKFLPTKLALESYVDGLSYPVTGAFLDESRLLVLEKEGLIRLVENGRLQDEPFLDLSHEVESEGSEQGLLNLVFDPNFEENNYFYVYYTTLENSTLVRYTLSDNKQVDLNSALTIITIPQFDTHHNGGGMVFGPDGYLYLGLGDGGGLQPFPSESQNLQSLLGSILRLDVSQASATEPYRVPADNPFVGDPNALDEIWLYGLRNPWRFDFDPFTDNLYIADVGDVKREEIDLWEAGTDAGLNYGWRWYEGTTRWEEEGIEDLTPPEPVEPPIYDYTRLALGGCSITGGYVYEGTLHPELVGKFIFSDFCSGFFWSLERDETGDVNVDRVLSVENVSIASFFEDSQGELYVTDIGRGGVYKIGRK